MILSLLASLGTAGLVGLLVVVAIWTPSEPGKLHRPLIWSLGLGAGLGFCSVLFFAWLVTARRLAPYPVFEVAAAAAVAAVAALARAGRSTFPRAKDRPSRQAGSQWFLYGTMWATGFCALVVFLAESAVRPHGEWDAWMTWNMHARAIFRGADRWREVLTGLADWSHPDYPLLVPATIARVWTYTGRETQLGPIVVGLVFTFATAGLLYGSVSVVCSRSQGLLAAALLLSTKFFVLHGTSQYADIPLGFYFLATLALLALAERSLTGRARLLALAGLMAAMAGWTKNEGLLFGVVVLGSLAVQGVRVQGWRSAAQGCGWFLTGGIPVLSCLLWFKVRLASSNDLLSGQGAETVSRFGEPGRYVEVVTGFGRALLEIGAGGVLPLLLILYLLVAGLTAVKPARRGAGTVAAVVCLMVLGYALILIAAPAPLLETNIRSINRLLLQLVPSALLGYFLAVRTLEEPAESVSPGQPAPAVSPGV